MTRLLGRYERFLSRCCSVVRLMHPIENRKVAPDVHRLFFASSALNSFVDYYPFYLKCLSSRLFAEGRSRSRELRAVGSLLWDVAVREADTTSERITATCR